MKTEKQQKRRWCPDALKEMDLTAKQFTQPNRHELKPEPNCIHKAWLCFELRGTVREGQGEGTNSALYSDKESVLRTEL